MTLPRSAVRSRASRAYQRILANPLDRAYQRTLANSVRQMFLLDLTQQTRNFRNLLWDGVPVWQNPFDLWVMTQTIQEVQPKLIIETGTYLGGSALYMAAQLDHLGEGRLITIDVTDRHQGSHPRVEYLTGSSTDVMHVEYVRSVAASVDGPVLVILDSDHHTDHVLTELEAYAPTVTPGSYMMVQDGIIDTFPFGGIIGPIKGPIGPLPAIERFISQHPEFEVDDERCGRFLITHSPKGWLRRIG